MKRSKKPHTPSYRRHKATGQAYVELNGQRIYLGLFELPETRRRYHQMIAEWEANSRQVPVAPEEITVVELVNRYRKFAEGYYCGPDGRRSNEPANIKLAMGPLLDIYGDSRACEYGPRQLKATREAMIARGWSRKHVNKQVTRIRRMYRWAAEEGLVPGETWHALQAVAGLKRGRTEAPEDEPVRPVSEAIVDETLRHCTPTLSAMIQIQRLTGMRPGELCIMRTCDIDRSGRIWIYRPAWHKTEHLGRHREIYIGPKAQAFLKPRLRPELQAFLFSPQQSEAERRAAIHAARATPMNEGNKPAADADRRRGELFAERYDTQTYGRAIAYACDQVWPLPKQLERGTGEPYAKWRQRLDGKWQEVLAWRREHRWAPNQLRHSFATMVRKQHGLEAAQVLLGHARADVTQVYAELDTRKGLQLAGKIG